MDRIIEQQVRRLLNKGAMYVHTYVNLWTACMHSTYVYACAPFERITQIALGSLGLPMMIIQYIDVNVSFLTTPT
jgi:hypothetical protein